MPENKIKALKSKELYRSILMLDITPIRLKKNKFSESEYFKHLCKLSSLL